MSSFLDLETIEAQLPYPVVEGIENFHEHGQYKIKYLIARPPPEDWQKLVTLFLEKVRQWNSTGPAVTDPDYDADWKPPIVARSRVHYDEEHGLWMQFACKRKNTKKMID